MMMMIMMMMMMMIMMMMVVVVVVVVVVVTTTIIPAFSVRKRNGIIKIVVCCYSDLVCCEHARTVTYWQIHANKRILFVI